jgi:signal transduction histidine kinase
MENELIHLHLLVDDLFTLARSEVGKLELRYELTDVGQLVRDIVEKTLNWLGNQAGSRWLLIHL